MAGRFEAAERVLKRAAEAVDAGPEVYARLGAVYLSLERLHEAGEAMEAALDRRPDWPELLSNLGGLRFREGDHAAAVRLYDRALALRPELQMARDMRGKALVALDRGDELVEEARAALSRDVDSPEAYLRLALAQRQAEQWAQAEATLSDAIERFPDREELRMLLITLLMDRKEHHRAGNLLKQWVEAREEPDWTRLALNRARIEARFLEAAETDLAALADTPLAQEPLYPVLKAKILIERARADEAAALLEETVDRFPGHAEARALLSHTLMSLGRLDEAAAQVEVGAALNPMAVLQQVENRGYKAEDHEITAIEGLFAAPFLEPDARARVGFTLATVREKRKDYDGAFDALSKANALARRALKYDWRAHRRFIDDSLDCFTPDLVDRLAGLGDPSARPIFVVGMPRSGTTLTEQILCSHPEVYGAGELPWVTKIAGLMPKVVQGGLAYPKAMEAMTEQALKSAARYYLDRIAEQNADAARVVDKMPHNFDRVGLIALMFPNAAIIHLDREPRDVALSNYYQNFAHAYGLMGFAYDLRDIGHMLNDHDRIMRHWHDLFPGRIFELNYQRLVSEPEDTIRALLDHCGLSWDDRVLRFYETQRPVRTASIRQVREGIYTSSAEKWRRYEAFLGPLEEVLAEGYKPLGEADRAGRLRDVIAGPTGLVGG
nr:tetratricopeptide repeat-containing sulfotransferase family protein [Roseospira goensis]